MRQVGEKSDHGARSTTVMGKARAQSLRQPSACLFPSLLKEMLACDVLLYLIV